MKKTLFVLVLALALAFSGYQMASANGGPHGGYTDTTDACAGCHRAHTATGARLLVAADTYSLCMTCHGSAGTGADTNVEDGYFLSTRSASTEGETNSTDNAPLLGGGFAFYGGANTTSTHDATGATAAAWGNAVNRGVTANLTDGNLTCASCHDPHGSANYRIIKETINGTAVAVAQVDEGPANKNYTAEQWGTGMSSVCAACHTSYHVTTAGSGSDAVEAANGGYTHRIDMPFTYGANANPEAVGFGGFTLPLAESGTNDTVVCETCHLPHGTSATMAGFASGAGPAGDSALLRLDNRGVCEVCHQK